MAPIFNCQMCSKSFARGDILARHVRTLHTSHKPHQCQNCVKSFSRSDALIRHVRAMHNTPSEDKFLCHLCGNIFSMMHHLTHHIKTNHQHFSCSDCGEVFFDRHTYLRHIKTHEYTCHFCGLQFSRKSLLRRDIYNHLYNLNTEVARDDQIAENLVGGGVMDSALDGVTTRVQFENNAKNDLGTFFKKCENFVGKSLFQVDAKGVKWYLAVFIEFKKTVKDDEILVKACFRSSVHTLLIPEDFKEQYDESLDQITKALSSYQREGSNWTLNRILYLDLNMAKYEPLSASSFMELPKQIRDKKAVLNIKNNDEKCFLWSVLAALHPVDGNNNANQVAKYRAYENELIMEGIAFPVKISSLEKFEKLNNISVTVLGHDFDKKKNVIFFPIRLTKLRHARLHVNLLYLSNDQGSHYCLIRNLNRLLSSVNNHHKGQTYYCHYCLLHFTRRELLDKHVQLCSKHKPQSIEMPKPGNNILKFQKYEHTFRVPYVIYADFECLLVPHEDEPGNTRRLANHVPSGFSYIVVGPERKLVKEPVVYRGEDSVQNLLDALLKEEEEILDLIAVQVPMIMTPLDELTFINATHCGICKNPFTLEDVKVRDHDHLTGHFRQAAHQSCNLKFKKPQHIPVIFHNLRGYDSHLIMQGLGRVKNRRIQCIPNNLEKYVSFSVGNLRFLDSLQFLNASLETLTSNLAKEGLENFFLCSIKFQGEKLKLLTRKGVFPYEHMDSFKKFDELNLPPIEAFYSSLTNEGISEEDYAHAQVVWKEFEIKNLGEYQDLYVLSDVLLLGDIFENFRKICLKYYELDPCHFYTSPGLSFEACLKMTGVELELLTDINMHLFVEEGIRGGVAMITKRYSEANNKYMVDYDLEKPSKFIMYYDMNNLYGYAMSRFLPEGGFRWLEEADFLKCLVEEDTSNEGYFLEVDLEYPPHLHDLHNDYPLAAERLQVFSEMISPYSRNLLETLDLKLGSVQKLVPNLNTKRNYVVHYSNLKQYLKLGLRLTKIHRVLAFRQSAWLKSYIDFNTKKRAEAKNDFEKDFFKLLNNAYFGKTMENLRNRIKVDLVTSERRAKKLIAKPSFLEFCNFSNDLVAIHSIQPKILLNKPIYVGFSVLELSKQAMYEFHYRYIKEKYGAQASLLFTDTDSLCYEIETDDVYLDMASNMHLFDTSNYPPGHFLHSDLNKKVVGKMKDEFDGRIIREFVGLRAKMYSVLADGGKNKIVGKGISRPILKSHLTHEDYKSCLLNKEIQKAQMKGIRSSKHVLYTQDQSKVTLSPFDDKRYILKDGINTLALGHCKILNS